MKALFVRLNIVINLTLGVQNRIEITPYYDHLVGAEAGRRLLSAPTPKSQRPSVQRQLVASAIAGGVR